METTKGMSFDAIIRDSLVNAHRSNNCRLAMRETSLSDNGTYCDVTVNGIVVPGDPAYWVYKGYPNNQVHTAHDWCHQAFQFER
jgi:hypothetical protein